MGPVEGVVSPETGPSRGAAVPRKFLTGTAWVAAASVAQSLFRLLLIAILTKYLGTARYGLWAIFLATVEILIPVAELGMRFGYSRKQAGLGRTPEAASAFYAAMGTALVSAVVFGTLLFVGAGWFASVFMSDNPVGRRMVEVGSPIIVFGAAELFLREQFGTFLEMRARGAIIVARFSLDVVAAVLAAALGWGPVALVGAMTVSRFLPTAVAAALVVRRFGLVRPSWAVVPSFVRFGSPLQLATVASLTMRLGDRQVLGYLATEAETGIFSASSDLGLFILMMVLTLQPGLFPALSALFNQGRRDQAVWLFEKTLKYFLFAAIPVTVFLSVAAGPLLTLITTAAFAREGALLVPFIAVGTTLLGVAAMARNLLGLVHKTGVAMALWVGAAVVKIGLTFLFVAWWGILGAGVSTLVTAVLLTVASWWTSRRELGWGGDPAATVKTVAAACVAAVPAWLLATERLPMIVASGACFSAVFVALMFALGAVRLDELARLRDVLLKREKGAPAEGPEA